jgi:hypothetical protein
MDQQWNWRENQALSRRLKNAKLRTANACVEEIDFRTARGLDKNVIRSLTQESAWVGTHENIFVLGQLALGRASSLALSRRRHVAMGTPRSALAPSRYSVISRWRGQTAAYAVCWHGSAALTSW